jgi:hypothetical protein
MSLFRHLADLETGDLLERFWEFGVFGIEFESGDEFDFEVTRLFEFLDEDFTVGREGIPILAGDYTNWGYNVEFRSAGRRKVSVRANLGTEGFWDGDRSYASSRLSFRPRPGYALSLEVEHNEIELPRGSFDTNVVRLDGAWDISPVASITGNPPVRRHLRTHGPLLPRAPAGKPRERGLRGLHPQLAATRGGGPGPGPGVRDAVPGGGLQDQLHLALVASPAIRAVPTPFPEQGRAPASARSLAVGARIAQDGPDSMGPAYGD